MEILDDKQYLHTAQRSYPIELRERIQSLDLFFSFIMLPLGVVTYLISAEIPDLLRLIWRRQAATDTYLFLFLIGLVWVAVLYLMYWFFSAQLKLRKDLKSNQVYLYEGKIEIEFEDSSSHYRSFYLVPRSYSAEKIRWKFNRKKFPNIKTNGNYRVIIAKHSKLLLDIEPLEKEELNS